MQTLLQSFSSNFQSTGINNPTDRNFASEWLPLYSWRCWKRKRVWPQSQLRFGFMSLSIRTSIADRNECRYACVRLRESNSRFLWFKRVHKCASSKAEKKKKTVCARMLYARIENSKGIEINVKVLRIQRKIKLFGNKLRRGFFSFLFFAVFLVPTSCILGFFEELNARRVLHDSPRRRTFYSQIKLFAGTSRSNQFLFLLVECFEDIFEQIFSFYFLRMNIFISRDARISFLIVKKAFPLEMEMNSRKKNSDPLTKYYSFTLLSNIGLK